MLARILVAVAVSALAVERPQRVDPLSGATFVRIPAGAFDMGSPPAEEGREAQERLHRVTVRAFYMAAHEVTQRQWTRVMGANPSARKRCAACPVERVNYRDVQAFIARLNAASEWPGFRLPTEAEWEYACRAGGRDAYGGAATLSTADANYEGRQTAPVGSYRPNAWGLFDMSGNVWEWTSDGYAPYPGAAAPAGPAFTPDRKVIRGGSWRFGADSARCALRYTHRPEDRGDSLGVRLAHDAE